MTIPARLFGTLGILTTAWALRQPAPLPGGTVGRPTILEVVYYVVGVISLGLGWYFNVRYTHQFGAKASYIDYTKELFTNWASDSAAQDYTIVNLVLLPLWTIVDGHRRDVRIPWIFFVMSLFTSLAFAMAFYLAFVERQIRYTRGPGSTRPEVAALGRLNRLRPAHGLRPGRTPRPGRRPSTGRRPDSDGGRPRQLNASAMSTARR